MEPAKELTTERNPGDLVWWKTVSGHRQSGRLKEWDNGTAIITMPDGTEKAVRCV